MEYDGAVCLHCGSAWFHLAPPPEAEGDAVGIVLDHDGHITGWAGVIVCMECDEPWQPRPQLRLVNG